MIVKGAEKDSVWSYAESSAVWKCGFSPKMSKHCSSHGSCAWSCTPLTLLTAATQHASLQAQGHARTLLLPFSLALSQWLACFSADIAAGLQWHLK